MRVSVVMPVLNEAAGIVAALERLQPLRADGHEVIVADGGSVDGSVELARALCDRMVAAPRGRATQMNAGAALAEGDLLLFVHADTRLPDDALAQLQSLAPDPRRAWGRFDVRIDGAHFMLPVIARMMNRRSRLTRVCTGDQCIFVGRQLFAEVGGYPDIALMEDVALCKRLRRRAPMTALAGPALTSGRRWEKHGVWRTILFMWWLRLRYFLGDSPRRLGRLYQAGPH